MKDKFMEAVYLTLTDELLEEYCVPGVENLFDEGKPCARHYQKMRNAYERLLDRLGRAEDDPDLDIMVDSLRSICKESGYAMYRCGARFSVND